MKTLPSLARVVPISTAPSTRIPFPDSLRPTAHCVFVPSPGSSSSPEASRASPSAAWPVRPFPRSRLCDRDRPPPSPPAPAPCPPPPRPAPRPPCLPCPDCPAAPASGVALAPLPVFDDTPCACARAPAAPPLGSAGVALLGPAASAPAAPSPSPPLSPSFFAPLLFRRFLLLAFAPLLASCPSLDSNSLGSRPRDSSADRCCGWGHATPLRSDSGCWIERLVRACQRHGGVAETSTLTFHHRQ